MGHFDLPHREKATNRAVRTAALPDDVDWLRVRRYALATLVQFGLIAATLKALDFVFPKISWKVLSQISLPFGLSTATWPVVAKNTAVFFFFLYMSFRSRVFSPLDNKRPTVSSESKEIQQRKRPNWMPPPLAFPFIWGTIGILRAASSLVVWKALGGKFLAWPFLVFLGHLCVGDTWNTINNVDKEYGVAALSMVFVVSSVYSAGYAYFQVSQKAGLILAPSCVWISIASFLVYSTWRMNLPRAPLYPKKKELSS
jgi:tryptophan-rich sensory protein